MNTSFFCWYSHDLSKVETPTFFLWKFTSSFIEAHLFNVFSRLKRKKKVMIATLINPNFLFSLTVLTDSLQSWKCRNKKVRPKKLLHPLQMCYRSAPAGSPAPQTWEDSAEEPTNPCPFPNLNPVFSWLPFPPFLEIWAVILALLSSAPLFICHRDHASPKFGSAQPPVFSLLLGCECKWKNNSVLNYTCYRLNCVPTKTHMLQP